MHVQYTPTEWDGYTRTESDGLAMGYARVRLTGSPIARDLGVYKEYKDAIEHGSTPLFVSVRFSGSAFARNSEKCTEGKTVLSYLHERNHKPKCTRENKRTTGTMNTF